MTSILLVLPAVLVIICCILFYVIKRRLNYWQRKKVVHAKPNFLLGNYGSYILLKKNITETVTEMCKKFPNEPYFGAYYGTEPTLVVQEPELLKKVLTKDFFFFNGREISAHADKEVFTQSLFFNYGDNWKVLRQNLTPLFSSAKMKNMFVLIEKCSKILEKLLDKEFKKSNEIKTRNVMVMYTMDCIGTCAFGVDTNVMAQDPQNPFKSVGYDIFEISASRGIKTVMRAIWPSIFYNLGFKVFPKHITTFFTDLILSVSKQRSKETQPYQNFVDLIFDFKANKYVSGDSLNNLVTEENKKVKVRATNEMLIAQCIGFFGAGFETSATTLTHTLFELAKKPECQEKVIAEVDDYLKRHDNKLGYECISELPYMQACVDEALRLYPVLGVLTREVISDYTLPSGLRLDKGVRVHIPVYHLQRHPDYWPLPEEYRPERFLPDQQQDIKPFTYMPFGEGPRICIGMRFAKMQMNSGLVTIFKKYRVKLAADMRSELELEPISLITQTKGEIRLEFIERTDIANPNYA